MGPPSKDLAWLSPTLAVGSFAASTPPECWERFSAILNLSEFEHHHILPSRQELKRSLSDDFHTLHIEHDGRSYCWLPFWDGDQEAFVHNLPKALSFLHRHEGKKRLVHCAAGVSRSVTTVWTYLCEESGVNSVEGAISVFMDIVRVRPQARPVPGFVSVLAGYIGLTQSESERLLYELSPYTKQNQSLGEFER